MACFITLLEVKAEYLYCCHGDCLTIMSLIYLPDQLLVGNVSQVAFPYLLPKMGANAKSRSSPLH